MSDITLSKQHGLNPSMDVCFWCGEPKGLLLMGALPDDAEAPREVLTDYTPCDSCAEKFSQGVQIIEVTESNVNNIMPITKDSENNITYYPTGRYAVLSRASQFIRQNNITDDTLCISEDVYSTIIPQD